MPPRSQKTPPRYGWARLIPESDPRLRGLSFEAREGFEYLCELAENATERREHALHGNAPKRLTVTRIAREDGTSPSRVYRLMELARTELFNKPLSDSAIYHRLRRDREHGDPTARPCAEAGCARPLPRDATLRRRYCTFHAASHARVARHRLHDR